jgi:hypothetical protein
MLTCTLHAIVEKAVRKAAERLYEQPQYDLILLSFARNASEFRQTELGVHAYAQSCVGNKEHTEKIKVLTSITVEWHPEGDRQDTRARITRITDFQSWAATYGPQGCC